MRAVVILAAAALVGAGAASAKDPILRVSGGAPSVLVGSGFAPRAQVSIRIPGVAVLRVRADRRGAFRVALPAGAGSRRCASIDAFVRVGGAVVPAGTTRTLCSEPTPVVKQPRPDPGGASS